MRSLRKISGLTVAIAVAVIAACGTDDGAAPVDPGGVDGSTTNDANDTDAILIAPDDAGSDACAVADAGVGKACTVKADCACNTTCVLNKCVRASACDEALLTWDGPTSNSDETCLTDLAGFNLHWGQMDGGVYDHALDAGKPCIDGPAIGCDGGTAIQLKCAYRLGGLDAGMWYFAVSAYNEAGVESVPSVEASKLISCP